MTTAPARLMMIVVATLVTSVALASERAYDKRLEAPPGGHLTLDTDIGSVTVVGGNAPEVIVHADLQGSESLLNRIHISAEQTPAGVTISAHSASGWLGWLTLDFGMTRDAHFTIEVPRAYPVDVQTSGGDVNVRDLNASVRAATSAGDIAIQNISGAVHANTSGGGIEAAHLEGPADLVSSGGSLHVTDSSGDLYLRTSGGGIHIHNEDGRVRAFTSGGSIRAELRANRGVSLNTSGGGITLLLPQNTHAAIEAESSGGGITSEFPVTTETTTTLTADEHRLLGTIGGGGPQISLRTSGGGIRIALGQ